MAAQPDADFSVEDFFALDSEESSELDQIVEEFAASRSGPRPTFDTNVDSFQRAFINCQTPTIRLLAPAGSGKTQSIAHRVGRLISEGCDPSRVLLLTFDNAAKTSLESRVRQTLPQGSRCPEVSTLNGFGQRLLVGDLSSAADGRRLGDAGSLAKHQSMIISQVLKRIREERPQLAQFFPRSIKAGVYRQVFSILKNEIITPETLRSSEGKKQLTDTLQRTRVFEPWLSAVSGKEGRIAVVNALLTVFAHLWKQMAADGRIDFDDQKLLPYLALSADKHAAQRIRSRFATIIVDEFQDINRLDFELVRILSEGRELVVVGDDDQAIYGFRGCTPDYIIDFEKKIGRNATTFELEVNYRSPANIVAMAKQLIQHNTNRVSKNTHAPAGTADADVKVWHSVNTASEAQILARTMKQIVADSKGTVNYSDIAVLYRVNSQSLPLQMAFILNQIPYYCRLEENLILSDAMTKIVGLLELNLKLSVDRSFTSDAAAALVYESFFRYHKDQARQAFLRESRTKKSLADAALAIEQRDASWKGFASAIGGLERQHTPASIVEHIGSEFRHLDAVIGNLEQALNDQLPFGELFDIAQRFKGTTQDFVAVLNDLSSRAREGLFATGEADGVNLLTYFKSKGRQWHTIFLPGLNQRVIPHSRSPLEDERRLFYVAVTRATANLVLSYVRHAVREKVVPSQFLAEMGMGGEGREKRATAAM